MASLSGPDRDRARRFIRLYCGLASAPPEEQSPYEADAREIMASIYHQMLSRLIEDDRSIPMIHADDAARLLRSLPPSLPRSAPSPSDALEAAARDQARLMMMREVIGRIAADFTFAELDQYDAFRRWCSTVEEVVSERGVTPEELFSTQDGLDAITRQYSTPARELEILRAATIGLDTSLVNVLGGLGTQKTAALFLDGRANQLAHYNTTLQRAAEDRRRMGIERIRRIWPNVKLSDLGSV